MGQIDNAQASTTPLTCIPEFSELSAGQEHTIGVVATFNAPVIKEEKGRLPIRLSAVLDKSGSMAGGKLDLVKAATKFMLKQLQDDDCLGVVSYDSTVTETLRFQSISNALKPQVDRLVDAVQAGSCTNLSGGLFKGLQQLQEWKEPDVAAASDKRPVYSVFLFTDGQANEGITSGDLLATAVQSNLANFGPTVQIHTFGFGSDHDSTFLRKISEASAGDYYYISTQEEIPTAFADALGGILSVSAQNVDVTISAGSADVTITDVNTAFKTERLDDGSYKVSFGDLFSEERKDMLLTVKVKPVDPTDPTAPPPALVKISAHYLDVNEGTFCTRDTVLTVPRPSTVPAAASEPHPEVVTQRARVESVAAMQAAMRAAERGDLDEAQAVMQAQVQVLSAMPQSCSIAPFLADMRQQEQTFRSSAYGAGGASNMAQTMQAYSRQRKGLSKTAAATGARNAVTERLVMMSAAVTSNAMGTTPQPVGPSGPSGPAVMSMPLSPVDGNFQTNVTSVPSTQITAAEQQQQQQQQQQGGGRGLLSFISRKFKQSNK